MIAAVLLLLLKSEDKHLNKTLSHSSKRHLMEPIRILLPLGILCTPQLHVYSIAILFFSMVTLIVVCLVMYFRIKDSFYKDFKTIGVMKALGISDREIRLSLYSNIFS